MNMCQTYIEVTGNKVIKYGQRNTDETILAQKKNRFNFYRNGCNYFKLTCVSDEWDLLDHIH